MTRGAGLAHEPIAAADRKQIERALMGTLSAAARHKLHVALRGDPALRAYYDRCAVALRILHGDVDVAQYEVDLIESWLVQDWTQQRAAAGSWFSQWLGRGSWLSVAIAAAAAAVVALVVSRSGPRDEYDGIRGGVARVHFGVDALCAPASALQARGGAAFVPADQDGCAADDTLAFSVYLGPNQRGVVSLFGIDADGDVMYYAPTPDDAAAIAVKPGRWRAVSGGVDLSINHAMGVTVVFGLLSPEAPSITDIDRWAAALQGVRGRTVSPSWLHRMDPRLSRAVCPRAGDCQAAQLHFEIGPARGKPQALDKEQP